MLNYVLERKNIHLNENILSRYGIRPTISKYIYQSFIELRLGADPHELCNTLLKTNGVHNFCVMTLKLCANLFIFATHGEILVFAIFQF